MQWRILLGRMENDWRNNFQTLIFPRISLGKRINRREGKRKEIRIKRTRVSHIVEVVEKLFEEGSLNRIGGEGS